MTRLRWYEITMPDTVIDLVNALSQGQHNDLQFFDVKKRKIQDLKITGVDAGESEDPNIELIETGTDIDPISSEANILPYLLERQDMLTIEE